jgi:hypothetical protein
VTGSAHASARASGRRSIVLLVLAIALASSAAEEGDAPRLTVRLDRGLLAAAGAAPPTSLLGDPAAAPALAALRTRLALLEAENDHPPWLALLPQVGGGALAAWDAGGGDPWQGVAATIDLGAGIERFHRWWLSNTAVDSGVEALIGGFAGWDFGEVFAGRRDGAVAMGATARIEDVLALAAAEPPVGPPGIECRYVGARLIDGLRRLAPYDRRLAVLDELSPEWAGLRPGLRARCWPEPGGWRGRVELAGVTGVRWARLDPRLAALAEPGADLTLALALPPRVLLGWFSWARSAALDDGWLALADHLTGDLLAQVAIAGRPVPAGAVALRCLDPGGAGLALVPLLGRLGAVAVERADAVRAWRLPSPAGALEIAIAGDRLVVGSDPRLVDAWLAGIPGGAAPGDGVLHLRVDAPAIARQWLPALTGLATLLLADDAGLAPVAHLGSVVARLREEVRGGTAPTRAMAALLADVAWVEDHQDVLRSLFPVGTLAEALPSALALHAPEGAPAQLAVVARFADGYALAVEDETLHPLTGEELATHLARLRPLAGPAVEALPVLPAPITPGFDRRWLPPPAVLVAHLPAWSLDVVPVDGTLVLEERGLPVATVASAMLAATAWQDEPRLEARIARARWEHQRGEVRARHVVLIAALQRIGAVIAARRALGQPLPERLSALVGPDLPSTALAPLFADREPTLAELDTLGWEPKPKRWPRTVLRLPLEGRWEGYLTPEGNVLLSDRLPARPPGVPANR